jgi:hypothetical protein
MAQTVEELGRGGQRLAARELGWHRDLIRKGKREVESGIICIDAFELRGRRLTEERLPNLIIDLKNIVDSQSQTDPKFKTNRLYTRNGIFLPELDELFYYFTTSKVTSDFMVDVLESWWREHHKRFPQESIKLGLSLLNKQWLMWKIKFKD